MTLTERHRQAQLAIRARALGDLLTIWPAFNLEAIDESWRAVDRALMLVIKERRTQSSVLATNYYRAFRWAEGVTTALPTVLPPAEAWEIPARISLHVTGPVWTKSAIALHRPDVKAQALVRVGGALTRHVLDGGRDTISRYARADRVGYRRVTAGKACSFCRMLAGRGAVYGRQTANFRSHDHCACSSEPVFKAV